jgi:hypothetical protein
MIKKNLPPGGQKITLENPFSVFILDKKEINTDFFSIKNGKKVTATKFGFRF